MGEIQIGDDVRVIGERCFFFGEVGRVSNNHGPCLEVKFADGSRGGYLPDELEFVPA